MLKEGYPASPGSGPLVPGRLNKLAEVSLAQADGLLGSIESRIAEITVHNDAWANHVGARYGSVEHRPHHMPSRVATN